MRQRFTFRAMAAEHEILVDAADASLARAAVDAAIADVQRIERKYSRYRDDSVVAEINASAGVREVAVDDETAALLRYADQCFRLSEGRFDITSGVMRRAWHFGADPPRVPTQDEIDRLLPLVDWSSVAFDSAAIRLPRAGMQIDLGGIGKEYAADRAAAILADRGIDRALVNLGGDVRALGAPSDASAWRVGIQHPRKPEGVAVASVEIRDGAVATSGDYQRYFDVAGRRYCHVIDARTGWPVHHWQSVSTIAPLAVVAGSCSTIAMLLCGDAVPFLESQGVPWLGIDAGGAIHGTLAAPTPR
jgi:thiamine biosynthesis lipoprotein